MLSKISVLLCFFCFVSTAASHRSGDSHLPPPVHASSHPSQAKPSQPNMPLPPIPTSNPPLNGGPHSVASSSAPRSNGQPAAPLPSVMSSIDVNHDLMAHDWFHGILSREEAENILEEDGEFLVRESSTQPGQYVLSGMENKRVKHLLLVDPEGVVSAGCVLLCKINSPSLTCVCMCIIEVGQSSLWGSPHMDSYGLGHFLMLELPCFFL